MHSVLSIITINLNNAGGLQRTLQSIASQQAAPVECIVIDGGSTDDSLEVVARYRHVVTTLVSEPDAGIYAAMNKGWQRATGEYCLFLNAGDDLYNPEVLGSLVSWLAQTDADYLYGNLRTVDADGSSGIQEFNEPVSLNYLFRWFVPHPASCIRRSLLLQLKGYSEEYRIISDWVFSIQAFCQGARFEHVPLCIANFYLDGISSTQQALAAREKQRVFEAELAWLKHDWEWYHRVRPLELSRPVRWLHRLIAAFK